MRPHWGLLILPLICSCAKDGGDTTELSTVKEDRYTLDKLKADMENMREEMKSHMSCNEQRNSQLTLEWAKEAINELRREMKEVEEACNSSNWQQEFRNELSAILAEVGGFTKLTDANGARLAAEEARHAEMLLDLNQIREIAAAAKHTSEHLKEEMDKLEKNWRLNAKNTKKIIHHLLQEKRDSNEVEHPTKLRHNRVQKHLVQMKETYDSLYTENRGNRHTLKQLQKRIEWMEKRVSLLTNPSYPELIETQLKQEEAIKNMTEDLENYNKLHVSMLKLLENVETLEDKVNKAVPDFEKEISHLDTEIMQMKTQHQYLKEIHDNSHQTTKALTVSVSNLLDKVEEDRSLLRRLNKTTSDLEDKLQRKIDQVLPSSCRQVQGVVADCVIAPHLDVPVRTACEDGWTLIQKRADGSEDFNRNFKEYAAGFGSPSGEYWIGNEALYHLTSDNCSSLRINMVDIYGKYWEATYDYFSVGSAQSGYRLSIAGFAGNATDALEYHNGMEFSTKDKDRDTSHQNCANNYEGGWWFAHCQHVNFNGKDTMALMWFNSKENKGIPLSTTRMMLRTDAKCHVNHD